MSEIIHLINSMAPFLLLGFFLAGLMHAFIPGKLYRRHLGTDSFKSVLYATLIAIPLPLCSCGVIPTAMSLRREGASRGSVISFLIATPQTGVDSILATYSLMGLPFAIVRPLAALFTALFGGTLMNYFERKDGVSSGTAGAVTSPVDEELPHGFWARMQVAIRYAFLDMMQDIGKWLAVGLVIAGLITLYVPESFFQIFAGSSILSILLVLVLAIPMYVCATGSIPVAIALMLKGLSPGAALVLLMAGPAVNVASMLVIHRVMGFRSLMVYLSSIVGGSVLFGLGIDYLFPRDLFLGPLMMKSVCCAEGSPWFQWLCSALLMLLLINALVRRFFANRHCSCQDESCQVKVAEQTSGSAEGVQRIMHIEGMACNHCRANVEKAISAVPGVKQVTVSLASGTAVVEGDCEWQEVESAVESIGFKVKRSE